MATTPASVLDISDDRRFAILVNAVSDYAIYLLDAEGRVQSWNTGAERFKGYSADEIIGEHFSRFYTERDRADGLPARALHQAATEGRFEAEGWRVRKDGSHFWTSVLIDPIYDGPTLIGFAKVTRDITERRQAEQEIVAAREALAHSQRIEAIGRLTGGVAHDFNNLLTVINGSIELLRRPNLSEAARARYLDALADTAERASRLTNQLLAFARRQPLAPEVLDLGARLAALRPLIETSLGSPVAYAYRAATAGPLFVDVDASQFETAIINLIVNARDAMPGGGRLELEIAAVDGVPRVRGHAAVRGPFAAIRVTDSGAGIPPHALPRIFEPFFTSKGDKGTGLGLSQVYGFVKQSRGEVDVASTVGRGTTFTLYLPLTADRDAAPAAPVSRADARDETPLSILLVEDNEQVAQISVQLLRELGQDVFWAGDARTAIAILEEDDRRFDIVFTDVVMPGMSGMELAETLKARWPALPVVLTSGYSHVLAEEGNHGFELLRKPYQADALIALLRRHGGRQPSV